MNLYAYVGNDSLNSVDPTGMCTGSRIENSDGTCRFTGGFTRGTNGMAQGMTCARSIAANEILVDHLRGSAQSLQLAINNASDETLELYFGSSGDLTVYNYG